jgi:hypothetical protein
VLAVTRYGPNVQQRSDEGGMLHFARKVDYKGLQSASLLAPPEVFKSVRQPDSVFEVSDFLSAHGKEQEGRDLLAQLVYQVAEALTVINGRHSGIVRRPSRGRGQRHVYELLSSTCDGFRSH